jgi:hypothetical protein
VSAPYPANRRGVCGLGPWLKPSLDFRGWTNFAMAAAVIKEALLAFDVLLTRLEQQHLNIVYVRTQGTLSSATDWANELHPTEQGFGKIADVFLRSLRGQFPKPDLAWSDYPHSKRFITASSKRK